MRGKTVHSEGAHTHVKKNKADTGDATAGSRLTTNRHSRGLPQKKKTPLMAEQQTLQRPKHRFSAFAVDKSSWYTST